MKEKNYYDLDGTLSTLNNSYDFAYKYHLHHSNSIRYFFIRFFKFIIEKLFFIPYASRRIVILNMMFYNIKEQSLKQFFEKVYKKEFLLSLTPLGKRVIEKQQGVLLTGCTSIPAKQIGIIFGLETISTEFNVLNGKIKGISQDTFGHLKERFIKKEHQFKTIYYTDDPISEANLREVFDEFKVVP